MDINNNNYGKNSFNAVRLCPHPAKWEQQVLGAVLNSKTIRQIVKDDAKNGKDTFITFSKNMEPPIPECPANRDMFLSVKGEKDSIDLKAHSTYWFIPGGFFKKPQEIKTGPEDLGKDLAKQIKQLDPKTDEPKRYLTLNDLKDIGKELIYENPKEPNH